MNNSSSEISSISISSTPLTRPKAISLLCDLFIETDEDAEEIEYLLSFLQNRRISAGSAASAETDHSVVLPLAAKPRPESPPPSQNQTDSPEAETHLLVKRSDSTVKDESECQRLREARGVLRTRPKAKTEGEPPTFFLLPKNGLRL